jgi:hypothetical protein
VHPAASSAEACSRVRLLLGRPAWPLRAPTRVATLRQTRGLACPAALGCPHFQNRLAPVYVLSVLTDVGDKDMPTATARSVH